MSVCKNRFVKEGCLDFQGRRQPRGEGGGGWLDVFAGEARRLDRRLVAKPTDFKQRTPSRENW